MINTNSPKAVTNDVLELTLMKLEDLCEFQGDLKDLSIVNYEKLKSQILELGFSEPVVVWENKGKAYLLNGHQRVRALKKMREEGIAVGLVPTVSVKAKDIKDAKKKVLSLTSQYGEITGDGFYQFLNEAEILFDDIKHSLRFPEIDFAAFEQEFFTEDAPEEDVTPPLPSKAKTQVGDLFKLGSHRLLCGDSTKEDDVLRLFDGAKPFMMITDPPYGIKLDMTDRGGGDKKKTNNTNKILNDDIADWTPAWKLFGGDVAYVWHASMFSDVVMQSLRNANFEINQQLIWNKSVHVLGRNDYHWKHEACWYAIRTGAKHGWVGDRKQMTVIEAKSPNMGEQGNGEDVKSDHPTQKPMRLIHALMKNHEGDVYDPFCGSGTTIMVADGLGKTCYSMELDPKYCDVILERYKNLTGQNPIKHSKLTYR